tara:strand:- start:281 stop:985 length:705 start_codon:yes stop_codon:yes gene_type:complete
MSIIQADLFSGLEGWRSPDAVAYVGIDNDPKFKADMIRDIRTVSYTDFREAFGEHWGKHDLLVTASPVCTGFTVMQIGRNWDKCPDTGILTPKTETARLGIELLEACIRIIWELECLYPGEVFWVFENPRAAMRKMPHVQHLINREVTWCQYPAGRKINTMKPTDLWVSENLDALSDDWWRQPCKNGAPCHVPAPRGSTTGTQGMDKAEAAKIPAELSNAIAQAILARGTRDGY